MQVTVSVLGKFHAFKLARELARLGHLHRLITTYPSFVPAREGVPGARLKTMPLIDVGGRIAMRVLGPPRGAHLAARAYASLAKRSIGRPDVCVAWSGSALPILREAKQRGALTVVERGSLHILAQRQVLEAEYGRIGMRASAFDDRTVQSELDEYREADRISVPTRFVVQSFLDRGFPKEKMIQVPYGVDLSLFAPRRKPDDVFRVLFVGRLSIRKGVHLLLEACAPLFHLPRFELLLVGPASGDIQPFLSKYRATYRRLGPVPHRRLPEVYALGSVLVLPSLEEGLAMVQAEAMASGLPLVCTPNTGAEELFTDGVEGTLVKPGDVEGLRAIIVGLYEEPERRAAMATAASRASRALTWERYGESMVAAYEKALREVGHPS